MPMSSREFLERMCAGQQVVLRKSLEALCFRRFRISDESDADYGKFTPAQFDMIMDVICDANTWWSFASLQNGLKSVFTDITKGFVAVYYVNPVTFDVETYHIQLDEQDVYRYQAVDDNGDDRELSYGASSSDIMNNILQKYRGKFEATNQQIFSERTIQLAEWEVPEFSVLEPYLQTLIEQQARHEFNRQYEEQEIEDRDEPEDIFIDINKPLVMKVDEEWGRMFCEEVIENVANDTLREHFRCPPDCVDEASDILLNIMMEAWPVYLKGDTDIEDVLDIVRDNVLNHPDLQQFLPDDDDDAVSSDTDV
ncbi:unnamed protein product [Symbiodinium sp. CCMP2592]|nr:unnamed protein product [Symbiodinium sp. CCMP2592]